jgi:hypothetical protein
VDEDLHLEPVRRTGDVEADLHRLVGTGEG